MEQHKERPILFSAPMVRAILEGRKTQTRRVLKPQPPAWIDSFGYTAFTPTGSISGRGYWRGVPGEEGPGEKFFQCPYGKPGDRLWVRETWTGTWSVGLSNMHLAYAADGSERTTQAPLEYCLPKSCQSASAWAPSIHMPRWASRITLEITDVRVERLQDISFDDAKAEGCNPPEVRQFSLYGADATGRKKIYDIHAQLGFQPVWDSINGEGAWEKNPWVWALTFKRIEAN